MKYGSGGLEIDYSLQEITVFLEKDKASSFLNQGNNEVSLLSKHLSPRICHSICFYIILFVALRKLKAKS